MKWLTLLIAATVWFLAGCSALIARAGQHSDILKRGTAQDTVRARLGTPVRTYKDRHFHHAHDVYVVKGKIGDNRRADKHLMWDTITVGLWEIVGTPVEVIRTPIAMLTTKKLIVGYDEQCKVVAHFLEGVDSTGWEDSYGADYDDTPLPCTPR